MKIIYQTSYMTETIAQSNKAANANEAEIKKALSANLDPIPDDFLHLVLLCNQLAAHEDAEIEIAAEREEPVATIFLNAPCFVFQVRQFILLQKITMLASEMIFDVTEEEASQITVSFDFTKTNELLYRQLEEGFLRK